MNNDLETECLKREQRFISQVDEMLENILQLEHDLNFYGHYIGNEKLFEAEKYATNIYYLVKKVKEALEWVVLLFSALLF